jgi:hypothetical protein
MNNKLVLIACLLVCSLTSFSQTKHHVDKKSYKTLAKQEAAMLKQQLNLNQKQVTEIEAVEVEFLEKKRLISVKPNMPTTNKTNELNELVAWRKGMYQKILTVKQYEDYEVLLVKRKEEYRKKSEEMIQKGKQGKG